MTTEGFSFTFSDDPVAKLVRLSRMCGWLALDAEKSHPEDPDAGTYHRGKALGYLDSARTLRELISARPVDSTR